jgi:hypothetical protein
MPLTLTVTEGVLPKGAEKPLFQKLCQAMLKWHGLSGNTAMTPNVVGSINVLPKEHTWSGLTEASVVFVEWKVPALAFTDRAVQTGYIAEATELVHEASGRALPKERIWCNIVHAVDGGWGIAGEALTNAQLAAGIAKG